MWEDVYAIYRSRKKCRGRRGSVSKTHAYLMTYLLCNLTGNHPPLPTAHPPSMLYSGNAQLLPVPQTFLWSR